MSVDLRTRYLGLELKHPIVASASPLTSSIDSLKRLEAAGVAAVVLPSLFEEQIEHEEMATHNLMLAGAELSPEAHGFFPEMQNYRTGPDQYLELIADAKKALSVPVIASLNGHTPGGWTTIARQLQDAGADAIELNVYFLAASVDDTSAEVEQRYVDLVQSVTRQVSLPVAVKVAPYFSAMANMAARLTKAGASGLVLFNRFLQPDISLERMAPASVMSLSSPSEALLPLRWIGLLYGRVRLDLAASTGVHDSAGALKQLLAGATVVQLASTLTRNGVPHLGKVLNGIEEWMERRGHSSIEEFRGTLSQKQISDPGAFERAQYVHLILSQNT